jgi:GST-like protein
VIDLYSWQTSNGRKVSIALEEMGLRYTVHPINIGTDEQFGEQFTAISPNQKIPAIVDSDGPDGEPISLFESGAILIYLARKCGNFLPSDRRGEYETLQWLMFQMGGIGPIFGQVHHFKRAAPKPVPYALERYGKECLRLYEVLDKRLAERDFVAAEQYTIADMAIFPWVARYAWQEVELKWFEHVQTWYQRIEQRPAVQRGMLVPPRP